MPSTLQLPPLALYIHIPWCVRKCPYCDFNSHKADNELPEAAYLQALLNDLDHSLPLVQGRQLSSIFIGGGTPSLFQAETFATILAHAEKQIGFSDAIEITLEANPGTFEQARFAGFRTAGINRLSMGIQSFNNEHLQQLGRIHSGGDAEHAIEKARAVGFNNINLDLMHGLPSQTTAQALTDLQTALRHQPEHLSWYQLTIEPNTVFYRRPPALPVADTLADIQDHGHELLIQHGFQHSEVSAYSQPGCGSRHNRNYWLFGDYIGIGAGAHGKITLPGSNRIVRTAKKRQPEHYLQAPAALLASVTEVSADERPLEFMMNALRLHEPIAWALFAERTGLNPATMQSHCQPLVERKLLHSTPQTFATTQLGQRFLNDVLEHFMDLPAGAQQQ